MHFEIDDRFRKHFKNLKQVFLYVIDECSLECPQCIYKPNNLFSIGDKEIPLETAIKLLCDFYELGARKLTFLGGEPTLYGKESNDAYSICDLVHEAKHIGYEYVRMATNGVFDTLLLDNCKLKEIDEISFSLDGYNIATNDAIRGAGNFEKTTRNIAHAIDLDYRVDITCCLYDDMLSKTEFGDYYVERFIQLAENMGIKRVNFHALVKDGTPVDTWTGDLQVSTEKWIEVYNQIIKNIEEKKYGVNVRIPQTFIKKKDFEANPKYFGFCPAKMGERVLVHPDGIIRICSGLLCTPYGVADYSDNKITWNDRKTNELLDHKVGESTPCTNRSKRDFGDYYPLCFSFKPKQTEFVYEALLNWETFNCLPK